MVGNVLVPELDGIYFAAVATRPELTLREGVGARRNIRRKDRLIARLEGGCGAVDLYNVDGTPFVDWLLAQHIVSIGRKDAVDGLDVVHPMAVDIHFAVISHGIVALEPQLNRVHVKLSLFEVLDPPRARRILGGVGIPESNRRELCRVTAVHFLPALVGDLVLVGVGGRNRRGRTRRLAGRIVGFHIVDVQILEGLAF